MERGEYFTNPHEHVANLNEYVANQSERQRSCQCLRLKRYNVNVHRAAAKILQAEKAARPAAPRATYCYPAGLSESITLALVVVLRIWPSGQASNLNVTFAVPAIAPFGA